MVILVAGIVIFLIGVICLIFTESFYRLDLRIYEKLEWKGVQIFAEKHKRLFCTVGKLVSALIVLIGLLLVFWGYQLEVLY